MLRGTVKKIVRDRGFGFITGESRGADVFFHVNAVQDHRFDSLEEGQSVEYELADGGADTGRGLRAGVVVVL